MKKYSVLCFGAPDDFGNIHSMEVQAESVEEAKVEAIKQMNRIGYPDAVVAPEIPGVPVAMELSSPIKKYRIKCWPGPIEGAELCAVEVQATDVASAKAEVRKVMAQNGYPHAIIPPDIEGMEIIKEIP